ncbi:MAG: hypothetical protein KatS3mg026_1833 [Bacteroidia bacterium]|nr:MAG: hypothetical protein KatS3mg026_1833 [Bacteroidia bacterium]
MARETERCLRREPSLRCLCPGNYRLPGLELFQLASKSCFSLLELLGIPSESRIRLLLFRVALKSCIHPVDILLVHRVGWATLLLTALAAVAAGDLAYRITGSLRLFWLVTSLYAGLPQLLRLELVPGSEGPHHAMLTLGFWTLYRAKPAHRGWLLLSGALFTWAILLRPIAAALLPLLAGYFLLPTLQKQKPLRTCLSQAGVFFLPFLLFELIWMPCNYLRFGYPYPLTRGLYHPEIRSSEWGALDFLIGHAGQPFYWFYHPAYRLPRRLLVGQYDEKARQEIRHLIIDLSTTGQWEKENQAILRIRQWEKTLQAEKPFLYHVGSRFWAFWHLLIAEFYEEVILLPAPPYSPLAYLAPSHRKRPTDPADSLHRALCHRMDPLPLETVPLLSPSNPLCLGYGPRIRRSPSGTKPIHGQLPYPLPHRWTGHLIPPAAPA